MTALFAALLLIPPRLATATPEAPAFPLGHPAIARVDVVVKPRMALTTTELTFTRGGYKGGDLEVFVAYGAPGLPRAFEAELVPIEPGFLAPPQGTKGKPVQASHALRAPKEASFVLGPRSSAGQALRLPEADVEAALAASGLGALRLRAVVDQRHAQGPERSLLVRLASSAGVLPLGPVRVGAEQARLAEATASLCGSGRTAPLVLAGKPARPPELAPQRAPRGSGDDLCVRVRLRE